MAKKRKKLTYAQMVKKAMAKARREASPEAAKLMKKKKLESRSTVTRTSFSFLFFR